MPVKENNKLPSRAQAVLDNIESFSRLSASQKIQALERQRRILVYLRTLQEVKNKDEVSG